MRCRGLAFVALFLFGCAAVPSRPCPVVEALPAVDESYLNRLEGAIERLEERREADALVDLEEAAAAAEWLAFPEENAREGMAVAAVGELLGDWEGLVRP